MQAFSCYLSPICSENQRNVAYKWSIVQDPHINWRAAASHSERGELKGNTDTRVIEPWRFMSGQCIFQLSRPDKNPGGSKSSHVFCNQIRGIGFRRRCVCPRSCNQTRGFQMPFCIHKTHLQDFYIVYLAFILAESSNTPSISSGTYL